MAIRPITIDQATPAQIFAYATAFLNLPMTGGETDGDILAKIREAQPGSEQIFVKEADTPAEVTAAEIAPVTLKEEEATGKMAGSLGKGDPRAIIFIPIVETEDGSGARDVVVGVNGRAWQLQRGHDLPVPWRVVEALQGARAEIIRHSHEEGHEGEVITHFSDRFGFNFKEKPSETEIAEWLERTGSEFCA